MGDVSGGRGVAMWLAVAFNVALAAGQVALFMPGVAAGLAVDAAPYGVDGLGLVFGVAWCLGAALAAWAMSGMGAGGWPLAAVVCLASIAALNLAYAREPLLFYLAWELAGLAIWLLVLLLSGRRRLSWLGLALYLPGVPFLVAILLGLIPPFAPPFGGEAEPWPVWIALVLGTAVLMRAGAWPFHRWARIAQGVAGERLRPMLALYMLAAPFVLAKALVAAPWEPLGGWTFALLGTVALLGSAWVSLQAGGDTGLPGIAAAYSSASLIGFGLASGSPLAAAGALALIVTGLLLLGATTVTVTSRWGRLALLSSALTGCWLISQAALSLGYGVIAALLVIAVASSQWSVLSGEEKTREAKSLATSHQSPATNHQPPITSHLLVLLALAAYPQALVWLALRPGVGAMAGGVGAPNLLVVDWGVGLRVDGAQSIVLAALPATGIAVAAFIAWATLHTLRRVIARIHPISTQQDPAPEQTAG